jgi:DMSO reductase anchor subunit
MHPAFSVIFLTTLIGVGQGLFLALYTGESYATVNLLPVQSHDFYTWGSAIALVFLIGGLIASFFHLGHPERAWRAATRWRTSWLSREVIVLPIVMAAVFGYGLLHLLGWDLKIIGFDTGVQGDLTLLLGAGGVIATFALFLCTGMIYGCIKFIQEWATPLTVVNYSLLGIGSGFMLATAFATWQAPELVKFYGVWTIVIIIAGFITRGASLIRNAHLKPKSSAQTAIGIRDRRIEQKTMGFMGGSFNTREFFHHAPALMFKSMKWLFLLLGFVVPVLMLSLALTKNDGSLILAAFVVQYLGLIAERWFFFAQANHPQNIYYQKVG